MLPKPLEKAFIGLSDIPRNKLRRCRLIADDVHPYGLGETWMFLANFLFEPISNLLFINITKLVRN